MGDASGMDGSAQNSSKPEAVTAQRRKWTMAERQRIVQASLKAGTTVDTVARVYGVNPVRSISGANSTARERNKARVRFCFRCERRKASRLVNQKPNRSAV
jgi:hypothetical protein